MVDDAERKETPTIGDFFAIFGRIGLLSFGGPAGQIALMHRVLVDERKWLGEAQFLHALNFCMLLPGPEAMQLATYAGWLMRGMAGGLIAGLLFVLPGFAVVTALSAGYVLYGDVPLFSGMLFGISAAVLAIVSEALVKVSRRALKGRLHVAIAMTAFLAIAFLKLPFPLIIIAAAFAGLLLTSRQSERTTAGDGERAVPRRLRQSASSALLWGIVWLVPLAVLLGVAGRGTVFADMALFFSKAAVVTFGGAYAVLAYVGQQAVEVHGWLTAPAMITGLGLAETTPGPLILVLVFVGFLGGANAGAGGPIAGGLAGAFTALWFTFAPCFLWIFAGAPFMERLRGITWLSSALGGVTAAVVGVIANLALWFSLHVLFGSPGEVAAEPFALPAPDLATLDWRALAISVGAGVALMGLRLNLFAVLGAAALAGAALGGAA
ncbi:MAG: chromate efflux transporter [Notoacmeibacter sp.]|nr:chromate efflux transporter [Notoacmeibacter sp.]